MVLNALFYAVSALALAGALGVVLGRSVVHCALFLLLTLVAVAGLFVLLFAPFLAMVQVLIYGGAIIIVLFFAVMLTRQPDVPQRLDHPQWPLALAGAGLVFGVFMAVMVSTRWEARPPSLTVDLPQLADSLFTKWAVAFEVASLVLLVALVGALIIARSGEER